MAYLQITWLDILDLKIQVQVQGTLTRRKCAEFVNFFFTFDCKDASLNGPHNILTATSLIGSSTYIKINLNNSLPFEMNQKICSLKCAQSISNSFFLW